MHTRTRFYLHFPDFRWYLNVCDLIKKPGKWEEDDRRPVLERGGKRKTRRTQCTH